MDSNSAFPASVYRDTVLVPIFEDAKRLFLDVMIQINRAHVVMLAECGILSPATAAASVRALNELDRNAILVTRYDGSVEDLFFLVEKRLAELCGAENAGRIHTARSRNDLDLTMYRMTLRDRLLAFLDAALKLREQLVGLAEEHRSALIPAYTHGQPAQPTTLGHYLMAFVEVLERDAQRAEAAYHRLNLSPLGACAITTTGFPINRARTAELLGFDGLQTNSYGAIASVDYLTESCTVLLTSMLNLGRLAQDLITFSTAEFGYLRLSDGYVQISSIMPQKRNPVPLEHTRILASRAMTEAQAILSSLHNTPFSDMNDSEDPLQVVADLAFSDGVRALTLLAGVLSEATFNTDLMRSRAEDGFLTVTELADTLVRTSGISFHQAHGVVASAVAEAKGKFDPERMVDAVLEKLASADVVYAERSVLLQALNAENFIAVRNLPGGPALPALAAEIGRAKSQLRIDSTWLATCRQKLVASENLLHETLAHIIANRR